jgi:Amt family ammonium transporter
VVTVIWSGAAAVIALMVAKALCGGLRVGEDDEASGLDVTEHGEEGYNL